MPFMAPCRDMDTPNKQFNPLFMLGRTFAFMDEATATLKRRVRVRGGRMGGNLMQGGVVGAGWWLETCPGADAGTWLC